MTEMKNKREKILRHGLTLLPSSRSVSTVTLKICALLHGKKICCNIVIHIAVTAYLFQTLYCYEIKPPNRKKVKYHEFNM